jgi:hypothetical protein
VKLCFRRVGGPGAVCEGPTAANLVTVPLGEEGTRLIPLLRHGGEAMQALGEGAVRLGLVVSAETAAASEGFVDFLTRLHGALEDIRTVLAEALIPALGEAASRTPTGSPPTASSSRPTCARSVRAGEYIYGAPGRILSQRIILTSVTAVWANSLSASLNPLNLQAEFGVIRHRTILADQRRTNNKRHERRKNVAGHPRHLSFNAVVQSEVVPINVLTIVRLTCDSTTASRLFKMAV